MADVKALANLHDIHLPQAISWWPLAPGWYLLMLVFLLLIGLVIYFAYRRYTYGRAKRQALRLLALYQQEYQQQGNSQIISAKISELLRRVALVYFPRAKVASLQGNDWVAFLNEHSRDINFNAVRDCLLELPYQKNKTLNLKPLFSRAQAWIKQRGIPCSN